MYVHTLKIDFFKKVFEFACRFGFWFFLEDRIYLTQYGWFSDIETKLYYWQWKRFTFSYSEWERALSVTSFLCFYCREARVTAKMPRKRTTKKQTRIRVASAELIRRNPACRTCPMICLRSCMLLWRSIKRYCQNTLYKGIILFL